MGIGLATGIAVLLAAPVAGAQTHDHPPPPPPPPPPSGTLKITAQPVLYPGFARGVEDYVVRCAGNQPVQVTVTRPAGTRVVVDGVETQSTTATVPVDLGFGESFSIQVIDSRTTRHFVRCLPADFVSWTARSTAGAPQSARYIVTPNIPSAPPYVAIFDTLGVPLWWMRRDPAPIDGKLLPNGNLAWGPFRGDGLGTMLGDAYEERRLDGSLVRRIATVGVAVDFHDLQLLPNGNYLLLAYRPRNGVDLRPIGGPSSATVLDGEIQEVTPAGALVWSWNSGGRIAVSETGTRWRSQQATLPDGRRAYDLVHINSVEPDGPDLIASFRHLDAVIKISKSTGNVLWKLGGTRRQESLTVQNDPDGGPTTFGGQHDARVYAGGTLTVYDNGSGLGRAPRAVRYQIDPVNRIATRLEQLKDPGAASSFCCGGARKLAGGNWVVSWASNPLVTESTPSGSRVFELSFAGGVFTYRAFPVLSGKIGRAALRQGMDVMNPRN